MSRWQLTRAADAVAAGGIIAYPTEAVYGLGCDPLNPAAVFRLLDIKQRPAEKGLILIASELTQLRPFIQMPDADILKRVNATWPGSVTWLMPKQPEIPLWLCGNHQRIAVRITAHPLAAALCKACGHALISTSANVSHQRAARNALQIQNRFGDQLDFILHGKLGDNARPSEIRDAISDQLIRAGG